MNRMTRILITLPEEEKRWLKTYAKRQGVSSAQVIRVAVKELRGRMQAGMPAGMKSLAEESARYGPPLPRDLADRAELKRRAAAAAGRFASGVPDLSVAHDRYLAEEEDPAAGAAGGKSGPAGDRRPKSGGSRGDR
jgi:hypothetical protein